MNRGFTLVEILVVIAIVAIVGTMLVSIFSSTLRGSNKAQILAVIKQNGQAVLENLDKNIRSADNVVCPFFASPSDTSTSSNDMVIVKDSIYIRYRFTIPPTGNGLIQQDYPVKQDIVGSSPLRKETDAEFINRICISTDTMDVTTGLRILTDTNSKTGVSVKCIVSDCTVNPPPVFVRNRSAGFKDQLTIQFSLAPGVDVPAAISDQIDDVTFKTTVQLR